MHTTIRRSPVAIRNAAIVLPEPPAQTIRSRMRDAAMRKALKADRREKRCKARSRDFRNLTPELRREQAYRAEVHEHQSNKATAAWKRHGGM